MFSHFSDDVLFPTNNHVRLKTVIVLVFDVAVVTNSHVWIFAFIMLFEELFIDFVELDFHPQQVLVLLNAIDFWTPKSSWKNYTQNQTKLTR